MIEGELELDFATSVATRRLDEPGVPLPVGMSFVDFVVEEEARLLLVEVKDPADTRATPKARAAFDREMRSKELINERLVPKCRDSYTFLHLMAEDTKPRLLVVLIGAGPTPLDPALLLALQGRLDGRLSKEADLPWRRPYVNGSLVVDEHQWARHLPEYPVHRV